MRKFVALFVLLAVLGLCVPSYGYILVYKVDIVAKGVDANADVAFSASAKAFLVLDMNDTDDDLDQADMLIYGKVDGHKVYRELGDIHEDFGRFAHDTATILVLSILQTSDTVLVSKVRSRFVGVGVKKPVPAFVKGRLVTTFFITDGEDGETVPTWVLDSSVEFRGYADLSLVWDEFMSKKANKADMTLNEVMTFLATYLEDHGYTDIAI